MAFTPYWDYKPTNAFHTESPGVYTSDKILKFSRLDKIPLKCDVVDGSIQNGLQQLILFSFVLDKKPGYKVFCEPETILFRKINTSVLNTLTFYLEDDKSEEVNFNGETLTFTLKKIKI